MLKSRLHSSDKSALKTSPKTNKSGLIKVRTNIFKSNKDLRTCKGRRARLK